MSIKKSPQTTGSDTRLYNPRSESEALAESDRDKEVYGPGDPSSDEKIKESKKNEREEREKKWAGLQHIKIRTTKPPTEEEPFAESTPQEDQTQLSDETGGAGNTGENLDIAVGARTGTGSSLGEIPPQLPVMGAFGQTKGDPMEMAFELLKDDEDEEERKERIRRRMEQDPTIGTNEDGISRISLTPLSQTGHPHWEEYEDDPSGWPPARVDPGDIRVKLRIAEGKSVEPKWNEKTGFTTGESMEMAWSDIRKVLGDPVGTTTLESVDRGRRSGRSIGTAKPRTAHRTKAFPRPIGGRSPWASTKRRASVHQRLFGNIKGTGGRSIRSKSRTGMMRQPYSLSPHHLGVGVMWGKPRPGRLENPGKYLSWLGRQSAYRSAGGAGVLLPYTPHAPREQLGQLGHPGPQGSGRMRLMPGQSQLAREGAQRATRGPPRPQGMKSGAPSPFASPFGKSEIEDLMLVGDLLLVKAYVRQLGPGLSHIDMGDFRQLLQELRHLLTKLPRKSLVGIPAGGSNSSGQSSAPANGPKKTSRNEGATETDPEDDPRHWGADPAGLMSGSGVPRRGHT